MAGPRLPAPAGALEVGLGQQPVRGTAPDLNGKAREAAGVVKSALVGLLRGSSVVPAAEPAVRGVVERLHLLGQPGQALLDLQRGERVRPTGASNPGRTQLRQNGPHILMVDALGRLRQTSTRTLTRD